MEGEPGKVNRTRLCRQGSDCQVRDSKDSAYKAKGFKQDTDMIILVLQEDSSGNGEGTLGWMEKRMKVGKPARRLECLKL